MNYSNMPYYPFMPPPSLQSYSLDPNSPMPLYTPISAMDAAVDRDDEYMKQIYPKAAKKIQKEVEEQCDKLEYDGSCMFDQFPDPVHLNIIVDLIYDNLKDIHTAEAAVKDMALMPPPPPPGPRPPRPCGPGGYCPPPRPGRRPDGSPDWFRNMIEVMLYHEMGRRRKRYRDRKRRFY